jgi:hypothetical protein
MNLGDPETHDRFELGCSHRVRSISRLGPDTRCVYSLTVQSLAIGIEFRWQATHETPHNCKSLREFPMVGNFSTLIGPRRRVGRPAGKIVEEPVQVSGGSKKRSIEDMAVGELETEGTGEREKEKEGSTDHQPNLVEDRQPSSSSQSHSQGPSTATPASATSASAQSIGQLEATSLPASESGPLLSNASTTESVSAPVHHPFLPELTELLQRVAPNLAVHALLLIKLGINSQEAVDEFVAEDDEDMIKMVVEALEQGIGDEAGLPRIQAQKLVIKLRKSQSS